MKKWLSLLLALVMLLSLVACGAPAAQPETQEPDQQEETNPALEGVWLPYDENFEKKKDDRDATGKTGAVASCSWYASKAGLDVLQAGGNAFDAAVATAFTLGVVEPYFSGLGGGGFMAIYDAETKQVEVVDFREMAPAAATPQMWLDEAGEVVDYTPEGGDTASSATSFGGMSVGVPGEVAGLEYILENYGSDAVTRQQIFQPAIDAATNGYVVGVTFNEEATEEYALINEMPELAKLYLDDATGLPYEVGSVITNKELASTLQLIADGGKDAFYTGPVAEAIVKAVQKYGGVMTLDDLANYQVKVRQPVTSTYRDYTIYSLPPASSGGTHLIEILNILENFDMASYGVNSPEYIHYFSEAFKMAFADRAKYMADTDFAEVPLAALTSKDYAKTLAAKVTDQSGTYEATPAEELEHYATTSFSVIDQWGNMVACTKTINYGFGSKVAVDGYGFIMNDEMDDFSADPESVNRVEPGKRPLSSMSPSIVLYPDGSPFLTIGSPGATRIFPTVSQVIERMIDYGMDIQEAIDCARIYDNASANVNYESGGVNAVTPETVEALQAMGHETTDKGEWQLFFGGVQGISIAKDGTLRGGADPRRDGKALAY